MKGEIGIKKIAEAARRPVAATIQGPELMGVTFKPSRNAERRFEMLRPVARRLNLALTRDAPAIEAALAEVIPIISSDFHGVENLMQGRVGGTDVKILDLFINTRRRRTVRSPWVRMARTAVYVRSDELKLPPFTIRHNPGWTRLNLGTNFPRGGGGIAASSLFYKNYSIAVQGSSNDFFTDPKDNALVRGFLTPSIQAFYEGRGGVGTFGQGKHFIFFTTGQSVEPQSIPVFLNDALEAFELFKAASRLSPIPEQALSEWLKVAGRRQSLRRTFVFGGCLMVMIPIIIAAAVIIAPALFEIVNPASGELVNQNVALYFPAAFLVWLVSQTILAVVYWRYMKRKLQAG